MDNLLANATETQLLDELYRRYKIHIVRYNNAPTEIFLKDAKHNTTQCIPLEKRT